MKKRECVCAGKCLVRSVCLISRKTILTITLLALINIEAFGQDWVTYSNAASKPGEIAASYVNIQSKLGYAVAFVATKVKETVDTYNGQSVIAGHESIGSDVYFSMAPTESFLAQVKVDGTVEKLFPLPQHLTITGLTDTLPGEVGAVVEPSVSEDGTRLYFAYFHRASDYDIWEHGVKQGTIPNEQHVPAKGADLYVLNLINKSVVRLTHRVLTADKTRQTHNDKIKEAMNPSKLSFDPSNTYIPSSIRMHPTEFRDERGLHLVYVSNEKLLHNSNNSQYATFNPNFNLFLADFVYDSSGQISGLDSSRQFQYYTTTSALSPVPLRNGLAFSYQASTLDARQWVIQGMDSNGKWYPLFGYGDGSNVTLHGHSLCVKKKGLAAPKDYLVALEYYNANNQGFGGLKAVLHDSAGTNIDNTVQNYVNSEASPYIVLPTQKDSYHITNAAGDSGYPFEVDAADAPSDAPTIVSGPLGKFTTPRCGGADELFFAYSPTTANSKTLSAKSYNGVRYWGHYHAYIGFRDNLDPFTLQIQSGVLNDYQVIKKVVKDYQGGYTLAWPTPLVNWAKRSDGDQTQDYSPTIVTASKVTPGDPFAILGSSAIYNTDVRTGDCIQSAYNGQAIQWPYQQGMANVLGAGGGNHDAISGSLALLRALPDPFDPTNPGKKLDYCKALPPAKVFGVALNLTSNTALQPGVESPGFRTIGNPESGNGTSVQESAALLGVYDVRSKVVAGTLIPGTNKIDASFKALVPANSPIEFQLLDVRTGLSLADVTSWHSLKPGEQRDDCGGCHNHKPGAGIPFSGSTADVSPPKDFVSTTPYIRYDPFCQPYMAVDTSSQKRKYPTWHNYQRGTNSSVDGGFNDVYSGFNQYCGGCHKSGSGNSAALTALSYSDEISAYLALARGAGGVGGAAWITDSGGALSSPALWAAFDKRLDGRNNDHPYFQKNGSGVTSAGSIDYKNDANGTTYGYRHTPHPSLCNGTNQTAADWVLRFGQWMDNHAPWDQGANQPNSYLSDRFHPAVDGALADTGNCSLGALRVGYWDDSGTIAKLDVELEGFPVQTFNNLPNGSKVISLGGLSSNDHIKVVAQDASGNTQKYERSVEELTFQCLVNIGATPAPKPDPSIPAAPSPTPPGSGDSPEDPQLTLDLNYSGNFAAGGTITFKLETNEAAYWSIVCSSSKGQSCFSQGSADPLLCLGLGTSELYNTTLHAFTGHSNSAANASLAVKIPAHYEEALAPIFCQAFGIDDSLSLTQIMTSAIIKITPGYSASQTLTGSTTSSAIKLGKKFINAFKTDGKLKQLKKEDKSSWKAKRQAIKGKIIAAMEATLGKQPLSLLANK